MGGNDWMSPLYGEAHKKPSSAVGPRGFFLYGKDRNNFNPKMGAESSRDPEKRRFLPFGRNDNFFHPRKNPMPQKRDMGHPHLDLGHPPIQLRAFRGFVLSSVRLFRLITIDTLAGKQGHKLRLLPRRSGQLWQCRKWTIWLKFRRHDSVENKHPGQRYRKPDYDGST